MYSTMIKTVLTKGNQASSEFICSYLQHSVQFPCASREIPHLEYIFAIRILLLLLVVNYQIYNDYNW